MTRARQIGLSILAITLVALAAACGDTGTAPNVIFLDRPNDVTFGCVGTISTDGGPLASVALSPASCYQQIQPSATTSTGTTTPTPDAGPPPVLGVLSADPRVAFVAEGARGDVAVANLVSGLATFVDSDGYTPGLNGLAVGRLPISIATSPDGCWVMTANSGSCDIGMVNVLRAAPACPAESVTRLNIHSTAGLIAARPAGVIAPPPLPSTTPPSECNIVAGTVWVAFSACHLVARVDISDGSILDGVRFNPGSAPEIVGPDVTCPVQCDPSEMTERKIGSSQTTGDAGAIADNDGGAGVIDDAGPVAGNDAGVLETNVTPVALAMEPDGSRLYIAGLDAPDVILIDLDDDGAAEDVSSISLEGAVGISHLAATGEIEMGQQGISGPFRFVYAIASDESIHVADVTPTHPLFECDTQLDRRYLHFITDVSLLPCFPVGGPMNAPRRAEAKGPGIRLPANALPLDVAFIQGDTTLADEGTTQPVPSAFNGTFAAVTSFGPDTDTTLHARGWVYFINVNDNNYEDFQATFNPLGPDIGLALPHTVRDNVADRRHTSAGDCIENTFSSAAFGPVRIDESNSTDGDTVVPAGFVYTDTGVAGDPFAPNVHRILCNPTTVLSELSSAAPSSVRGPLFADLEEIPDVDNYSFTWEGPLQGTANLRLGASVSVVDTETLSLQQNGGPLLRRRRGDRRHRAPARLQRRHRLRLQRAVLQSPRGAGRCAGPLFPHVASQRPRRPLPRRPRLPAEVLGRAGERESDHAHPAAHHLRGLAGQRLHRFAAVHDHARDPRLPGREERQPRARQPAALHLDLRARRHPRRPGALHRGVHHQRRLRGRIDLPGWPVLPRHRAARRLHQRAAGLRARRRRRVHRAHLDGRLPRPADGRPGDRRVRPRSDLEYAHRRALPSHRAGLHRHLGLVDVAQSVSHLRPAGAARGGHDPHHSRHLRDPFPHARPHLRRRRRRDPVPGMPDQLYTPVGPGYQVSFDIAGGFLPYALEIGAQLPGRVVTGPDGSLWIVDSGEAVGGSEGQLINAGTDGVRVTLF